MIGTRHGFADSALGFSGIIRAPHRFKRWLGADAEDHVHLVRVSRQLTEVRGAGLAFAPPKSDAGRRVVALPEVIVPVLRQHLASVTADVADALVFTRPDGMALRHSNFRNRVWLPAVKKARVGALHFHDLRHTGNHLIAGTGATLRELMDRMGHTSTRAALIYQHGSGQRQQEIAQALSKLAEQEMKRASWLPSGRAGRQPSGTQHAASERPPERWC